MHARTSRLIAGLLLLGATFACSGETPPQPDPKQRTEPGEPVFSPDEDQFIITYAGEKGEFADCTAVAEVPEVARERVGVNVYGKPPPPGHVWITNLTAPDPDGRYALEAVERRDFERSVLGIGRASTFELPTNLDAAELRPDAARSGPVIVYKTSWCGVCKQVEAYLRDKGVEYIAKDIETDRAAAAELQAKAKAAGVATGSVPMIDVGGELLRGFDRKRLDKLL
jgi:glutaredoxin